MMTRSRTRFVAGWFAFAALNIAISIGPHPSAAADAPTPARHTRVSIVGDEFHINGRPTYAGREWNGHKIQGLLMNSRMVQGIFHDRNPATVQRWAYPDTGQWDPERNTREFLEAMSEWRRRGLLAFTINLQGGSPEGYSNKQPWHNSAIESDGSLRADYLDRLGRILDRADELGMVAILGYFYFGQDERLTGEAAVVRATDNATDWLLNRGYQNVLVEINNECDVRYDHPILQPARVHELIQRVQARQRGDFRLLASTSYGGGSIPLENVVRTADFLLIHGNGVAEPDKIAEMVRRTRKVAGYTPKPILFNEDDHFEFDKPKNNFIAAVSQYASWGYFDPGKNNYQDGYQSPPVRWNLNTERKRAFFNLLQKITGAETSDRAQDPRPATRIERLAYHGWPNSILMSNGQAEVVIVPAIGRVMQFRFPGDTDGPFWENRVLDGQAPDPESSEWRNFGGDKTWPAPQAAWPAIGKRGWPPPAAFDSMPAEAMVDGSVVTLRSPLDPNYGIRAQRQVRLEPGQAAMTITTRYEKVSGDPVRVAVWVITQLDEPVAVYAPVPESSLYASGYNQQSSHLPKDLKVDRGLLSLVRDPQANHKIGCDAGTLLWVGERVMVRMDSPRVADKEYPDQGSSAEVYTNADPLRYVELEMLGPLRVLAPGDTMEQTVTYRLFRRTSAEPEMEARTILSR